MDGPLPFSHAVKARATVCALLPHRAAGNSGRNFGLRVRGARGQPIARIGNEPGHSFIQVGKLLPPAWQANCDSDQEQPAWCPPRLELFKGRGAPPETRARGKPENKSSHKLLIDVTFHGSSGLEVRQVERCSSRVGSQRLPPTLQSMLMCRRCHNHTRAEDLPGHHPKQRALYPPSLLKELPAPACGR